MITQFIMFRIFETQRDDADVEARPVSPAQSPPMPVAQFGKVLDDLLLDSLATLSKTNGIAIPQHGARLAVMGELLVSVLTHLPDSMRTDRDRVEYLMSLSDDTPLPENTTRLS